MGRNRFEAPRIEPHVAIGSRNGSMCRGSTHAGCYALGSMTREKVSRRCSTHVGRESAKARVEVGERVRVTHVGRDGRSMPPVPG